METCINTECSVHLWTGKKSKTQILHLAYFSFLQKSGILNLQKKTKISTKKGKKMGIMKRKFQEGVVILYVADGANKWKSGAISQCRIQTKAFQM